MANWGKPDFDIRSEKQQEIDREAPQLRARLKSEGKMYMWPHNDEISRGYNADLIQEVCVRNAEWQKIRLSMKGVATHEKLQILKDWWDKQRAHAKAIGDKDLYYHTEVQVGNYLGALRRGGQVDDANRVRRYI